MRKFNPKRFYLQILQKKKSLLGKARRGKLLSVLPQWKKRMGSTKSVLEDNSQLETEHRRRLFERFVNQAVRRIWSSQARLSRVEEVLRKLSPRKGKTKEVKAKKEKARKRIARIVRWLDYGKHNGALKEFTSFLQKAEEGAIMNLTDPTLRNHKKFTSGEWMAYHSGILNVIADIRNWINNSYTRYKFYQAKDAIQDSQKE